MYTGYDAKTLPGVREAVEAGRYRTAQTELARVTAMLESLNRHLNAILGQGPTSSCSYETNEAERLNRSRGEHSFHCPQDNAT